MARGEPNAQTIATAKYQKKAGYRSIAFKMRGDLPDRFNEACERAGRSRASVIAELMQEYIDRQGEMEKPAQ